MPNRSSFKTHGEYLLYCREWRLKNAKKIRKYKNNYNKLHRRDAVGKLKW